jgi:nucleotide-binding universal stress UspA family protein
MILIAYDGTPDAQHAIAVAGSLLFGGPAEVVHVWEPVALPYDSLAIGRGMVPPGVPVDDEYVDAQEEDARAVAESGADLALEAGFHAEGRAVRAVGSKVLALEEEIDRLRPDLVVIGSRGLTGLKALLKGSFSHHVGAHSHAPVLIVPPAAEAGA